MAISKFSNWRINLIIAAVAVLLLSIGAISGLSTGSSVQELTKNSPDQSSVQPTLSDEQMQSFLLNAQIIGAKPSKKGVTSTSRLTLSDGTITHDASFQLVNEFAIVKKFDDGRTEINFRDSFMIKGLNYG